MTANTLKRNLKNFQTKSPNILTQEKSGREANEQNRTILTSMGWHISRGLSTNPK